MVVLLLAGCEGKSVDVVLDSAVKKLFTPKRTPQQYMIIAVSDPDPDLRRSAVAEIADSKQSTQEWAIKGFATIALLETDTQARCVAMRALGKSRDPRAVETALRILNYRDYPPEEVRPPEDLCRWDAMVVLADASEQGWVPEESGVPVRDTMLDFLRNDPEKNVRIAAARGLGFYPATPSVEGLIAALRDPVFAVVHECESSLVRLTGCTHDCDYAAWSAWLDQNEETLFANAGHVPESRRPPYNNKFEKFNHDVKQAVGWLIPDSKN